MRLIRRFTFYLFAAVVVILVADSYVIVREQITLYDKDMRQDESHLGRALALAIERAWRERGEEEALAIVEGARDPEGSMRVRFVRVGEPPGSPREPRAPDAAHEALGPAPSIVHTREGGRAYTYVPLDLPDLPGAGLEISEGLALEHEFEASRVRGELWTTAILAVAFGLLAWVLGVRVVGRPIAALVEKARRVGGGDFSGPLVLRQRDELSRLAAEMNVMAEHLAAAREKVVAETTARIAALEQLRHADRLTTVGELASGLAHELGTPLHVVAGRARTIAEGEVEGPEEARRVARIIVEQAERMTRIVRQLLDFARRRSVERRPTDLGELARQTAALLAPLAAKRRVRVSCEIHPEPLVAGVDPSQIQQALTNLLVNAIQAMPRPGVVALRAFPAQREGRDETRPAGRYVVLEVADQGEGIPAERMSAIFDPFFTTKPVGEGTGLGLSVAYGIVREHGGWIEARSEPSKGSEFRIWLPRERAA